MKTNDVTIGAFYEYRERPSYSPQPARVLDGPIESRLVKQNGGYYTTATRLAYLFEVEIVAYGMVSRKRVEARRLSIPKIQIEDWNDVFDAITALQAFDAQREAERRKDSNEFVARVNQLRELTGREFYGPERGYITLYRNDVDAILNLLQAKDLD